MNVTSRWEGSPWLLLVFTLPSSKASERVGIWRKLQKFGSIPLRNSGYIDFFASPMRRKAEEVLKRAEQPRVKAEKVRTETASKAGSFVSSHTFKFITPAMTDKYKMPNPCASCHAEKSTDCATKDMLTWKTTSPWTTQD
jgi:hypothetical protein